MVFSGGERVSVVGTNAETLTMTLNRVKESPIRLVGGGQLGEGWIDVQTDNGVILVNPAQVAYVRDVEESAPVLDQAG
jgi:exopolysaccharide biosynthesis predicted pyruvyltransferase EpsI